jgi:hypothetical protein
MVPLEDMLSVDKDTAKWLIAGTAVEWGEERNRPEFNVYYTGRSIYFNFGLEELTLPYNEFSHSITTKTSMAMFPVMLGQTESGMKYIRKMNSTPQISNTDMPFLEFAATCTYFRNQYYLLRDGTITKTCVSSSRKRTVHLLKTMTERHHKKLTIPERSQDYDGLYGCVSMKTPDGRFFWIQNYKGDLDIADWQGSNDLIKVATSVRDFKLLSPTAAVYQTTDFDLKLINLKLQGKKILHYTVKINASPCWGFEITPSIQSLWVLTAGNNIIRYYDSSEFQNYSPPEWTE